MSTIVPAPIARIGSTFSGSWLSRAMVELDEDCAETPSALAEVLARLLAISLFAAEVRAAYTPRG